MIQLAQQSVLVVRWCRWRCSCCIHLCSEECKAMQTHRLNYRKSRIHQWRLLTSTQTDYVQFGSIEEWREFWSQHNWCKGRPVGRLQLVETLNWADSGCKRESNRVRISWSIEVVSVVYLPGVVAGDIQDQGCLVGCLTVTLSLFVTNQSALQMAGTASARLCYRFCIISVLILFFVSISISLRDYNFSFYSVSVFKIISVFVLLTVNGNHYFYFQFSLPLTKISLPCSA